MRCPLRIRLHGRHPSRGRSGDRPGCGRGGPGCGRGGPGCGRDHLGCGRDGPGCGRGVRLGGGWSAVGTHGRRSHADGALRGGRGKGRHEHGGDKRRTGRGRRWVRHQ
ncbi:MAG: hypothetical protein F4Y38_10625 [Gemmatimonadetes bacterium]|nr:hypothetical protein [Gemmatimonadota bacterium]MYG86545.1 hypothetical protein [Gemmatimonadota bacterium]MYJ89587.1 hypothetical protein [Gemmatimonadota bacterium]